MCFPFLRVLIASRVLLKIESGMLGGVKSLNKAWVSRVKAFKRSNRHLKWRITQRKDGIGKRMAWKGRQPLTACTTLLRRTYRCVKCVCGWRLMISKMYCRYWPQDIEDTVMIVALPPKCIADIDTKPCKIRHESCITSKKLNLKLLKIILLLAAVIVPYHNSQVCDAITELLEESTKVC